MKVATTLQRWLFAMLVGFVIVACNRAADDFVASHSSFSQSSLAADCRAVQHVMGETQVCGQPQKIAVLGPSLLEILLSLEMQPAGVANYFAFRRARYDNPGQQIPYLGSRVKSQPASFGQSFTPSLEALLKLKPDLSVGSEFNRTQYHLTFVMRINIIKTKMDFSTGMTVPLDYANALNLADIQELCDEAQQKGEVIYQQTGSEIRFNLPQRFGRGGESETHLRNKITLIIRDIELWQPIKLENHYSQSPPLISKFHLSGNSRVLTPNIPDINNDYMEVSGCNYIYHLPEVIEFEEWYKEESIQLVMVLIYPSSLKEFDESCECLPQPLRRLAGGDFATRFHQPLGKTTAAMKQVLHQILHCPHQGMMKQMYLESKALELLTLQFTRWTQDTQKSERFAQGETTPTPRLQSDDVERLHHAREILLQQIDNPPSLLALARQVGLDDCKLKWGFRRLFGTTVFGYLHEYRMERARQFLATGQMSVTEVAYAVGYNSLPSFSKAFRKRFGSSPLAYNS